MQLLAGVGIGAFVLVGLAVGVRLLALARRTRELPELLIGLTLLALGPVGFPAATFALRMQESAPHLAAPLLGFALAVLAIGGCCNACFTWLVFRRDRRWAHLLAAGLCLGLVVCWCASAWRTGFDLRGRGIDVAGYAALLIRAFALAWNGGESIRYWRQMRRRLALGLADPVTTNRFLLWGIAAGTATLISVFVVFTAGAGARVEISNGPALFISVLGLGVSAALWLAFLPPRSYLEWIRRQADAAASPADSDLAQASSTS